MKKLMMMAVAGLMMTGAAVAQNNTPKAEKTPEEIAAKRSATLKEKLTLSDDQTAQVKTAITDFVTKSRVVKQKYAGADNKKGMGKEMKPIRDEYMTKMKSILTAEQNTKWEQMKAEARAKHKERKGAKGKGPKGGGAESGDLEDGLDF